MIYRTGDSLLACVVALVVSVSGCAKGDLAAAQPSVAGTPVSIANPAADVDRADVLDLESAAFTPVVEPDLVRPQHTPAETLVVQLLRGKGQRPVALRSRCVWSVDSLAGAVSTGDALLLSSSGSSPTRCVVPPDSLGSADSVFKSP